MYIYLYTYTYIYLYIYIYTCIRKTSINWWWNVNIEWSCAGSAVFSGEHIPHARTQKQLTLFQVFSYSRSLLQSRILPLTLALYRARSSMHAHFLSLSRTLSLSLSRSVSEALSLFLSFTHIQANTQICSWKHAFHLRYLTISLFGMREWCYFLGNRIFLYLLNIPTQSITLAREPPKTHTLRVPNKNSALFLSEQ